MKTLYLVRHGKSSWEYDLPDHKRPLEKRAYNDAELVLSALQKHLTHEVKMYSSKAVRALETAKMFKKELQVKDSDFTVLEDLYAFNVQHLMQVIQGFDDRENNIMIFGHNPAFTSVANYLGDDFIDNVPTTGLVCISFQQKSWKEISDGKTLFKLFPKMFRS
ncbi:histidine phosphatase family protein [Mesonia sp. K7]|uniref:SixA phosphatase family protein n=1 Tax=Mesonia sp. K7 TaxID=2218606 RepID=UPI000DA77F1B|nr:histidine phosphatase family protein [Mesonia sp. K7]PZD79238.1 histidine phosphatase family protein [Mesonia sp. K7]